MIAAVIPTLNAAERLVPCLSALVPGAVDGILREVVVADGGSQDASRAIAADMGCCVVEAPRGRARQLLAGIAAARAPWLLLLHGDSVLAPDWVAAARQHVTRLAASPPASGGAAGVRPAGFFRLQFDETSAEARRVAGLANWRARTLGLPYGDQGLLIHRETLAAVGGLAELPFLEDLDLVRRLGRRRLVALDAVCETSAARYRRDGWLARPARNILIAGAFLLGVPATALARLYR